jgi:pimeloyl-ACP methyl ester carboxylesterase
MRETISLTRLLKRFAITIVVLYISSCSVLYVMQRSLLYDPHPLLFSPDAQNLTIPAQGVALQGWVVNPGKPEALIYYGGKGESVERDVAFFRTTLPDCSVYLVPYRGYGPNPGSPTEAGLFADALVVYAWVHTKHTRVSVMGRSLGTGVATWVASERDVDRLILVTPYDSIVNVARERYWMFPVALFMKDPYESWRYAGSIKARILVVLAEHDDVIPRAHSDALMAHFPTKPEVVVVPHSNHNNLHHGAVYAQAIEGFMGVQAATPPATPAPQH